MIHSIKYWEVQEWEESSDYGEGWILYEVFDVRSEAQEALEALQNYDRQSRLVERN